MTIDSFPIQTRRVGIQQILDAEGHASSASTDANRAETARDAAFVNADVFADIAIGRAAVADGEQFQVVTGDEIIRYRRDSSSTQTEVARYPSASLVLKSVRHIFGTAGVITQGDNENYLTMHSDEPAVISLNVGALKKGREVFVSLVGSGPLEIQPASGVNIKGAARFLRDDGGAIIRATGDNRAHAMGDLITPVAVAFDFYVDQVNGNDNSDGLTPATAWQTLTKARAEVVAAGNNTSLGLARGSVWRDRLSFGETVGVTVGVYGSGAVPEIIATDPATGWTQPDPATFPNLWQITGWVSECINSNFPLSVFEDGRQLVNRASLALANSNPGSSFITTSPTGSDTLVIHATGSGNPNSNGSAYEAHRRRTCIETETAGTVELNFTLSGPVKCIRPPWNSGGIVSARGATFKRAAVKTGTRGSFLTSGLVQDVIYSGANNRTGSGSSNMLVFFTSSPPGVYPGAVRRAGFVAGSNPDMVTFEDVSAMFSHNDMSGVIHNCTSEQCWFVDIAGLGGFRGATHEHIAPYAKRSGSFNLQVATAPAAVPIKYGMFNRGSLTSQLSSWDAVHDFQHCVSYDANNIRQGNGFKVQNSVWYKSAAANANAITTPISTGIPNIQVNNSICVTETWSYALDMGSLGSYTGDYNIFASFLAGRQARFRYNGVENAASGPTQFKLKWWQDQTGQDANSVYILSADQTIGGVNALFLGWREASSGTIADHGPSVGDFRINPDARVYSGLDVAYIGTFPNGDPLVTNVGPQYHWDWNDRAVANGAPRRWPVVPETDENVAEYTANPAAWNFYP